MTVDDPLLGLGRVSSEKEAAHFFLVVIRLLPEARRRFFDLHTSCVERQRDGADRVRPIASTDGAHKTSVSPDVGFPRRCDVFVISSPFNLHFYYHVRNDIIPRHSVSYYYFETKYVSRFRYYNTFFNYLLACKYIYSTACLIFVLLIVILFYTIIRVGVLS